MLLIFSVVFAGLILTEKVSITADFFSLFQKLSSRTFLAQVTPGANEAVFYFSPETGVINKNNTSSTELIINTSAGVTSIKAYLNFNFSAISITGIDTTNSVFTSWWENSYNNITGKIQLQASLPSPGHNGAGLVAKINFQAINTGTATVTYDATPGNNLALKIDDTNILNLTRSTGASFTITEAVQDTTPPSTTGHNPAKSSTNVSTSTNIVVQVNDSGTGVNQSSLVMRVGGIVVSPVVSGTPASYTLTYNPPSDFNYNQAVNVTINAQDLATPANIMTQDSYSFTIIAAPDGTPPTGTISISNGSAYAVSQSVTLNLSASDASGVSQMSFSNDNINWSAAESYSTTKSWTLTSGEGTKTVYVKYKDTVGNWNLTSFSDTIILDTVYPVISNTTASSITMNSALITWTTGESATSRVEYGLTASYGSQTVEDTNLVTSHQVSLSGLTPSTLYHYRVSSKDAATNQSISVDKTFTTLGLPDTTPPSAVSGLGVSNIFQTSVRLNWVSPGDDGGTGIANSYDIRYSTGLITEANWAAATQVSGEPAPLIAGTSQSYVAVGLSASTLYYFAIKTLDEVPNTSAISNIPSATTLAPPDITPPTITITVPTTLATYSTTTNPINLAGSASDNIGVTQVTWVNSRGGSGAASGTTAWSILLVNLQSGDNTITVTASDAANNTITDILTVTYDPGSLSVSLIANNPSSPGQGSLNDVDLTAVVSGTVLGNINYTFYCNRSDSGINVTPGYNAKYDGIAETSKVASDLCDYASIGTYYAKVIAERGGNAVEARVEITVTAVVVPPPPPPPGGGGSVDTTPPSQPLSVSIAPTDKQIALSWVNPTQSDFVRVLIVRKEAAQPTSRTDGTVVYEGDQTQYLDAGLTNGIRYYYALYSYDAVPNYSMPAFVNAEPVAGKESIEVAHDTSVQLIGDLNKDGKVNVFDLSILLSNWKKTKPEYDLNGDNTISIFDLSAMLSHWTK
ncbi:MAG: fibronectin type III domain-containing protein [Candidatus Nealsonbacteria bacterium]